MKRSVSVSRVVFHPSTLAVFSGVLGAIIGFLINRASGGHISQLIWIALIFAMLFSLSITAWQGYTQEQTGRQWMTMLQEMVFQTYFLTLLADKPEISQLAQQRLGQVLQTVQGEQQVSMVQFFSALPHGNLPFSISSRHFPTTLHWFLLQEHHFAHLLWSGRRAWGRVIRKRKISREASQL